MILDTGHCPPYDGESVNMDLVNPIIYWRYFGNAQKNLQRIAKIIYSMIPSSSMCETNFRDTEYIYCKIEGFNCVFSVNSSVNVITHLRFAEK